MQDSVRDNRRLSRFELEVNGEIAFTNYSIEGAVIVLMHTETPVRVRGQGVASKLVDGILKIIRDRGLKVVPRCSFVRVYFMQHPNEGDILAK